MADKDKFKTTFKAKKMEEGNQKESIPVVQPLFKFENDLTSNLQVNCFDYNYYNPDLLCACYNS